MYNFLLVSTITFLSLLTIGWSQDCKCYPGDSCWPLENDFDTLNKTVSGHLIHGIPPASVCYRDQPNYNANACEVVAASWFSSTFHASDPVSVGWPWWANNTCPPIYPNGTSVTGDPNAGTKGCTIGGYPAYALNATNAIQVQAVVKFAKDKNIRLNIKSTGHSFQGRSTAYGSLSVWTHNYRGAQWHDNFHPENCTANSSQMAATFAAGERVRDVYEFAAVHDAIVVAGSAEDVGIMGWFTGGGHGPLSSTYGMGADNVLQIKVVTTSGELLTANACQNEDLFWALSGGGGGTFGVVTEVTMKAYPSPQTTQHMFSLVPTTTANLTDFFNSVAYVLSELPRLKVGGMQGTMALVPPQFAGLPPQFDGGETMVFSWGLNVYDKPNGTIERLFAPIAQKLGPLNGSSIFYTSQTTHYPDFFTAWNDTIGDEAVGTGGVSMGSRLLPETAFVDQQRLVKFLQNATTPFGGVPFIIELCLVANSNRRGDHISMNPAWRDTVAHFVIFTGFPDWDNFTTAKETFDVMTFQRVAALKSLAPESGAYLNEADPYDPNWQDDFFGANYARLREIKKKYDPQSSLWCLGCVGSEDWVEVEQQTGRICRTERATSKEL